VVDKLSDGRRPISTERAGAGGSDPIKAAGDERNGSPGDREPWKAQASSPAVPSNRAVDHGRGTRDGAMLKGHAVKRLGKKARRGFRGYPVATIAFYGPDNRMATKGAVTLVLASEQKPAELRRWLSDGRDVRTDPQIATEILTFLDGAGVKPWLTGSSAARTRRASTTRDRPARGAHIGPDGTGGRARSSTERQQGSCEVCRSISEDSTPQQFPEL
jgi:hypothetical protein